MTIETTPSPCTISSNTFHAPMTTSNLERKDRGHKGEPAVSSYLESLAVEAARAQLLDDALGVSVSEAVSGPRRQSLEHPHRQQR